MKKILLLALTIFTFGLVCAQEFIKNVDNYYRYQGPSIVGNFVIDCTTDLNTSDFEGCYSEENYHIDSVFEKDHVGYYKWCVNTASRSIGGHTYTNYLWNSTYSTPTGIRNNALTNQYDRPGIYLPTIKYGIDTIIVEGWTVHKENSKTLDVLALENGQYKSIDKVYASVSKASFTLKNNTFTSDTILIKNSTIKDVCFFRGKHNEQMVITKIKVVSMPAPEYAYNETTQRYDYIGEPLEDTLEVDFTQLPSYKKAFNTTLGENVHADTCLEFEHVGLYKWSHNLQDRSCEGKTYTHVLSNYGNSDVNGVKTANNASSLSVSLKPTVYLPTMKNGISKIIVEGWTNNNTSGNVYVIAKDADGTWKAIDKVNGNITKTTFMLKEDKYTKDTLTINNYNIKNVAFYRQHTPYQFITKITIIPMEALPEVVIDENEDNKTILETYKGQTVNLTVYRTLRANIYNTFCLPGEVSLANFRTAIDDPDCEARWFSNASIDGNSLNLTFTTTSTIQAGFPYLIKPTKDITEPIRLENVKITYTTGRNIARPNDNALVKFFSTLSPTELSASEDCLVLSGDNTLYFVDETVTMPGMRGYFILYNEAARAVKANKMPMRAIFPPHHLPI